jgi:regulatory protein YycI of two-component signal transduction system YycFG
MDKLLKTNNKETWKKIAIAFIIGFIILLIILGFSFIKNKLNKTIESSYINGTINGQLILISQINQYKEFPFLINVNNETRVDSIQMCSNEFLNYLNNLCKEIN